MSLTMRPLTFSERGVAEPSVSLRDMLAGLMPAITGASPIDLGGYAEEILRSGFPGIRDLPERARQATCRLVRDDHPTEMAAAPSARRAKGAEARRRRCQAGWRTAWRR